MYYLVSFHANQICFAIREEDFSSIASEITSHRSTLLVVGYISQSELPETYVLLTHHS